MDRDPLMKAAMPLLQGLRKYHRHTVVGLEHVPKTGRALVVVNHSLATYDITLLMTAIYAELGRMPRPLIDRLFFKIPFLGDLMGLTGAVKGSQETAEALLAGGELVTVAPGGMREALRPSTQRYQIRWDRRLGFAKLAMKMRAPIILAACPRADDLYEVYPSYVTSWFYKTFKVPVFLARGIGPTPLPRPVHLVHYLSEPLQPPPWSADEATVTERATEFHAQVVARMKELISEAVGER